DDPPAPAQLRALREDAAHTFGEALAGAPRPQQGIAVAGTATQSAAILGTQALARNDLEALLDRLASVDVQQRRRTPNLDPDRAPTIVAGVAILLEATRALRLDRVEVSDRDILIGAALEHTGFLSPHPQF